MKVHKIILFLTVLLILGIGPGVSFLWANPPNIVLTQAIHVPSPDGELITLLPGKYFVEQAGPTELRVTRDNPQQEFMIHAKALTHNQYELFSPMALTRPKQHDEVLIELYLPGGIRLEATGSSKEPPQAPSTKPMSLQSTILENVTTPDIEARTSPTIISDSKSTSLPAPPIPTERGPPTLAIAQDSAPIRYRAPFPDVPGLRINAISTGSELPTLLVLTPNHMGLTSQEQPSLFWYLSQTTHHSVDIMISEERNPHVLLEVRLLPPLQAGIHPLRLEDYEICLIPDLFYRWTVRIMTAKSTNTLTANGMIQRILPSGSRSSASFASALSQSPGSYAQNGLWYDALSAISRQLQGNSANTESLVAQRTALLEQVGLPRVAAFTKQAALP